MAVELRPPGHRAASNRRDRRGGSLGRASWRRITRSAETARRLRATIGEVFRFAVATGRAENDPTGALRGALATPTVNHRAAIIEPKAFGGLLRAIAGYDGEPETRAALELLALTFVRPGELRAAEWAEFDLDAAVWAIPAEKMKMKHPHRVPLAPRAVAILRELQGLTGHA